MRNVFNIFLFTCEFWHPGAKFTYLGTDVQQGAIYQCAKCRPVLTTCVRDICRQTSLISLTAWSTNSKRQVPAYHATTTRILIGVRSVYDRFVCCGWLWATCSEHDSDMHCITLCLHFVYNGRCMSVTVTCRLYGSLDHRQTWKSKN